VKPWFVFVTLASSTALLAACSEQAANTPVKAPQDFAANAETWLPAFQPSTLSETEQLAEMAWFTEAATDFRGMSINVASESLTTHEYETTQLTKAFYDITGIRVTHDLIQQGDVIEKLQTQMQSGANVYDQYVNDSTLVCTHARFG